MENFNIRLIEERERLGLKKGGMARAGGVANSTYTKYEDGSRLPDAAFLSAIAAAGADVQYILTGVRSGLAPAQPTADTLNRREQALLDNYRHTPDEEGKKAIEQVALIAAKSGREDKNKATGTTR